MDLPDQKKGNKRTKPTCKVVQKANQRGARIYPKGCQARRRATTDKDGATSIRKYARETGKLKGKKTSVIETTDTHYVNIKVNGVTTRLLYDTGAAGTTLNFKKLKDMGYINQDMSYTAARNVAANGGSNFLTEKARQDGVKIGAAANASGSSGNSVGIFQLKDVPVEFRNNMYKIKITVLNHQGSRNQLMGVNMIKAVDAVARYKVKYRKPSDVA